MLKGVIPGLARFAPQATEIPPADPDREEERFYAALAETLVALVRARGPVLIVIEDAHRIDGGSAQVLLRVARLAKTLPLMLLVTGRDDAEPADERWGTEGRCWRGRPRWGWVPSTTPGCASSSAPSWAPSPRASSFSGWSG